jgi:tetratricopeptide (TPR) repeat protein
MVHTKNNYIHGATMRTITISLLLLICLTLFAAETNPVQQYFTNPSTVTFQAAWNTCNEALAKDSTATSQKVLMATLAYYESERLLETLSENAMQLDTGSKFQYANLLLSKEQYEKAIPIYQSLNDSIPAWSCPWRHKGTCLYYLKKYPEAEVSLQKAVETNVEHYDAYIWLAKTQFQLKKYKLALENLKTGMKLDPNAEGSDDTGFTDDSVKTLHQDLLKKVGKK